MSTHPSNLLSLIEARKARLAVIGLGYVGLPLAVEFGRHYDVVGFDVSSERLEELRSGHDRTREVRKEDLVQSSHLRFSDRMEDLKDRNFFIVTVPTPIDLYHRPDLTPLLRASATVGKALQAGAVVIYESTVYPGCTEEDCVPILERESGLAFNREFFCGYSPERINPGDKVHTVTQILKVTSGSTPEVAAAVDALYASIIKAGTHLAPSIRIAEAAKVIENSQRDINIAFVNELSLIFNRLGIDTEDVLAAAGTKWNFLPFRPGLVGGHCIGVDPYYLTHKAEAVGYNPQIILAGRRLNDNMGSHVASRVIKLLIRKGHRVQGARILMMGITFKENCPDIRNSHVVDVIRELADFGCLVDVYDPWADPDEVRKEYGLTLLESSGLENPEAQKVYDGVVLAVAHEAFRSLDYSCLKKPEGVIFDIKAFLDRSLVDGRL